MKDGDDPDMKQIAKEEEQWVSKTFETAVNQEKLWAEYLFKDGSMIGLNDKLLKNYVEWIANRRMKAIGIVQFSILLRKIIHFLGPNIGFLLKDSKLPHKRLR